MSYKTQISSVRKIYTKYKDELKIEQTENYTNRLQNIVELEITYTTK